MGEIGSDIRNRAAMNSFEQRKKGFEEKFAHDAMLRFKAEARRNRALGAWAAELLKLPPDKVGAYIDGVIAADVHAAGDDALLGKLQRDFAAAQLSITEAELRKKMQTLLAEAKAALAQETS